MISCMNVVAISWLGTNTGVMLASVLSLWFCLAACCIKLLSKPRKTVADNPIKSQNRDTYIAHLCQLSHSLKQLRRD